MSHTIAVVSNDIKERGTLTAFLQKQGYTVIDFSLQPTSMLDACNDSIDLILLDMSSLQCGRERDHVFQWISEWRHLPIIILMPANSGDLAIQFLNAGIDNYILKPVRRDELLAKTRALLRRLNNPSQRLPQTKISISGLTVDLGARRAFIDSRDIRLTRKEFLLLAELVMRIDAICTHEELLAKVWGGEYWDANHYLHVYFGRIRKKLGSLYGSLIETIPGMGYMLHSSTLHSQPQYAHAE